jgi:hypothetical protein
VVDAPEDPGLGDGDLLLELGDLLVHLFLAIATSA